MRKEVIINLKNNVLTVEYEYRTDEVIQSSEPYNPDRIGEIYSIKEGNKLITDLLINLGHELDIKEAIIMNNYELNTY